MKLPNSAHEARPWRIREIARDFTLEDVWALPVFGAHDDFAVLLEHALSFDPADSDSLPTRLLWRIRDLLGSLFDLGRVSEPTETARHTQPTQLPIPGTHETSLAGRLAPDLRHTLGDARVGPALFSPLYRTDTEYAGEISNKTVHAVIHLAWVDQGTGRYQGQMAIYVKPRGTLGKGYMALIRPFRYVIVYPALMRQIERSYALAIAAR